MPLLELEVIHHRSTFVLTFLGCISCLFKRNRSNVVQFALHDGLCVLSLVPGRSWLLIR